MITLSICTYKRPEKINQCLNSIDIDLINEILIFNDDEKHELNINKLKIDEEILSKIKKFEPSDFNLSGRKFRKPFYMNQAALMAKSKNIFFSDDDAIFNKNCINKHVKLLNKYKFCCGGIRKNKWINKISASILQGTNYSMEIDFYNKVGGYDEFFIETNGGGDFDFWYRVYRYVKKNNIKTAYIPQALQRVHGNSSRNKKINDTENAKLYTLEKHNLNLNGPMYKWCPDIRNKALWMDVIK